MLLVSFQTDYLSLADQLSAYTVSLLDKVRGHDELELVINKAGRDADDETYERLARFKMAIKYKEKKVSVCLILHIQIYGIIYTNTEMTERLFSLT